MLEYAALVASPRALPDGLILVFQHPANKKISEDVSNVRLRNCTGMEIRIDENRRTGPEIFRKKSA